MGDTLLLIGARGFLGSHVRPAAEAAGLTVVSAGREDGTTRACDLLDPASIAACLEEVRPDLIVNAAGSPSVVASWERPAEAFEINAFGVLNLLEAVACIVPDAHLHCLSSAAVYGEPAVEELPLDEGAALRPVSPYGAAKAAMELLCGQYVRSRGLHLAIVRAYNMIGPGLPSFAAASGFARKIAEAEGAGQESVCLGLGNPGASRDLIDVRDAAQAVAEVSRRRLQGTYNLCTGKASSVAEQAAELAAASTLEVETKLEPGLARLADPSIVVGDPSRLREAIGFTASTPLARSLGDLLDWWRQELG